MIQVGPFGAALTLDATSFDLTTQQVPTAINFRLLRAHAIVAWAFFKYQLVVGLGVQGVTMSFGTSSVPLLSPPSGVGPEAGMLLKLDDQPWRLGVSARAPVSGGVSSDGSPSGYILPSAVVSPAQIQIGFALQLGPRPLNPRWIDPSDEIEPLREKIDVARSERAKADALALGAIPAGPARESKRRELDATERAIRRVEEARLAAEEKTIRAELDARFTNWPRPRLLVVADAVITAPVDNAVPISGFLNQQVDGYGKSWTISPRFGLEGEPFVDRFKLRVGSYLEPSLFDGGAARQHFTFGGDLKLFEWNFFGVLAKTMWQLSFATDFAPRYTNWGLSIGVWR